MIDMIIKNSCLESLRVEFPAARYVGFLSERPSVLDWHFNTPLRATELSISERACSGGFYWDLVVFVIPPPPATICRILYKGEFQYNF